MTPRAALIAAGAVGAAALVLLAGASAVRHDSTPPPSIPAPIRAGVAGKASPKPTGKPRVQTLAEAFVDQRASFGVDPLHHTAAEADRIGAALGCRPVLTELFVDVAGGVNLAGLLSVPGVPVVTVEPTGRKATDPAWTLEATVDGAHDAQYRAMAATLAKYPGLVVVRFAHEMNGDWYPWGTRNGDNTPGRYVAAWRHVQQVFRTAGASNVAWLWSPNLNRGARPFAAYYPGDDWVDLVGMTGYGTPGEASAQVTFGRSLREMRTLTRKRIVLTELSVEPWSGRTRWITSLGPFLRDNRDVAGVIWVERNGPAEGARYDWRFDRSPQDTTALAGALKAGGTRCGP